MSQKTRPLDTEKAAAPASDDGADRLLTRFCGLSRTILRHARAGVPEFLLLREVSRALLDASGADAAEWWIHKGGGFYHCQVYLEDPGKLRWEVRHIDILDPDRGVVVGTQDRQAVMGLLGDLLGIHCDAGDARFTAAGSFFTGDGGQDVTHESPRSGELQESASDPNHGFPSQLVVPLPGEEENLGFLQLKSRERNKFSRQDAEFYEVVAETLAVALAFQGSRAKLQERVKELGCLYAVVHLAEQPSVSLQAVLRGIAELIPPAWQYPEIAAACIEFDGEVYPTPGFRETPWQQSAEILVANKRRGRIDVVYLEERPRLSEGPFLEEERHLIDTLAQEISGIVERREVREDMARLEDQVRHSDRLATLGQLAAGVAHELNEPLGAILGFAQLAEKAEGVPEGVRRDLGKIVDACLYSRRIVSKLRLFSRELPPELTETSVNQIIEDALAFIKTPCGKQGIRVVEDPDPGLPRIVADRGQLHQVLVNLLVNAVQAMPDGGVLTVRTRAAEDHVVVVVEDTGVGMSEQVKDKIFLPFFTTKSVEHGTGLGLAVVHGIVTAHGGTIQVDSQIGRGSRFELRFPASAARPPAAGQPQ
jgi:signal transduction histidine kinase